MGDDLDDYARFLLPFIGDGEFFSDEDDDEYDPHAERAARGEHAEGSADGRGVIHLGFCDEMQSKTTMKTMIGLIFRQRRCRVWSRTAERSFIAGM